MATNALKSKPALGFLTVLDHPQFGLFGGYLVLNKAGRPLEFHCTAPIKPNRAQQILYGLTLESFLYGEQIGRTLVQQSKADPLVICTDRPPALAVREHVDSPVALVLPPDGTSGAMIASAGASPDAEPQPTFRRIDPAHGTPSLMTFHVGRNRLAVPGASSEDRQIIAERLADLSESFDLTEPFTRIREAIEEAQQGVGRMKAEG